MATRKNLLLALEMITEGEHAPVPSALRAEAATVYAKAKPWALSEGIQGVGIGEKTTDAEMLEEVVIKVYVEKKKPKAQVDHLVPKEIRVPGMDEPIPTDVEEIGQVELESNTGQVRPAIPGFGVWNVNDNDDSVGTFGCLVRKRNDAKTLYILSNSHVLADDGVGNVGDPIVQPGVLDGGKAPADVLAELSEWVPFQFTNVGFPDLVDAAIAKVKSNGSVTSAIRLIGVPVGVSTRLRRRMRVQKTGRTTDYTQGIIRDINYRLTLDYKRPGGGVGRVGLQDQVLCTRYTAGGDSGSAVLNMQGRVVGLHFAGSPSSSIFNKIGHVLNALQIEIVTEEI